MEDQNLQKTTEERVKEWVNSPEGKRAIQENMEQTEKHMEYFNKACEVTPEQLSKPICQIFE